MVAASIQAINRGVASTGTSPLPSVVAVSASVTSKRTVGTLSWPRIPVRSVGPTALGKEHELASRAVGSVSDLGHGETASLESAFDLGTGAKSEQLSRRAGQGIRQGFGDAGPLLRSTG